MTPPERILAAQEPDFTAATKGLDAAIAAARARQLACHVFIMSSFHWATNIPLENMLAYRDAIVHHGTPCDR